MDFFNPPVTGFTQTLPASSIQSDGRSYLDISEDYLEYPYSDNSYLGLPASLCQQPLGLALSSSFGGFEERSSFESASSSAFYHDLLFSCLDPSNLLPKESFAPGLLVTELTPGSEWSSIYSPKHVSPDYSPSKPLQGSEQNESFIPFHGKPAIREWKPKCEKIIHSLLLSSLLTKQMHRLLPFGRKTISDF